MTTHTGARRSAWYCSRTTWVLIGFLAIGAFYLMTEHQAHALGALPYLLFLLCPLMHLFMHGALGGDEGHAGHERRGGPVEPRASGEAADTSRPLAGCGGHPGHSAGPGTIGAGGPR
jgi:hypothetical protein